MSKEVEAVKESLENLIKEKNKVQIILSGCHIADFITPDAEENGCKLYQVIVNKLDESKKDLSVKETVLSFYTKHKDLAVQFLSEYIILKGFGTSVVNQNLKSFIIKK